MFNTKPWNNGFPGIPKEIEQDISNLQSRAAALEIANNFSTSEIVVGKWIDGSTLYQKTVATGNLPNNEEAEIVTGLPNNAYIRHLYGYIRNTSNVTLPLPHASGADGATISIYATSTNNVRIRPFSDRSAFSGYITLLYTKTPPTRDGDTEPDKDPEDVKEPETKTTKKTKKGE